MDDRLREAVAEAAEAFWAKVAEKYPETQTGDLSPSTTALFNEVVTEAVEEWVLCNVPGMPNAGG